MEQLGRKKTLARNTKFAVIRTIVQYVIQFILRTIFIYTLGKAYLGLNGLFSNIIGCLSIVELGVGTAIVFSMYKPIAENDIEKVKSLNALYKKCFSIIALIITVLGLAIIPVLKFTIKSDIPADINIYVIYLITLFNTVLGYFWAHNRSLLFAYQRNDIENKIGILQNVLLGIAQTLILVFTKNYYAYIICTPIFTVLENLLIAREVRRICPNVKGRALPINKETSKELRKNVIGASMGQIGGVFVTSTDNILISSMLGLAILGVYTNYATIILAITACVTLITSNARSVVGNLIATESSEFVHEKFKVFNFFMYWLTGVCTICLLGLLNPFIYIWTNASIDYLLDFSVVIVLVINFYISNTLSLTATFTVSAGLMWQNKWKTIIQGLVNIVFSIIFAKWWGLIGIFLGTLVSYLVAPLWIDSHVLYKNYFKKSPVRYWIKYIKFSVITLVAGTVAVLLCNLLPSAGIGWFGLKVCICGIVPNIMYILCYFNSDEFKKCFSIVKTFISNIFTKKKKEV